jgi:hypothetical protein
VCAEIGKECIDFDQERRPDAQAIIRRLDEVDIIVEEPGDGNQQLFGAIGRELSLKCLLRLSRSYYGTVASLNRSFRSLVRNGEIYRLRRLTGVAEHWIYVCSDWREWKAYDLERRRWIQVPRIPGEERFVFDDWWLAVGTDLLGFGCCSMGFILLRYSVLTNSWIQTTLGTSYPLYGFGSTSVGQKAYLVGGYDRYHLCASTAAAIYDSEKKVWERLPNMNSSREGCSAAFMDSKLYVIGGGGRQQQGVDMRGGIRL